MRTKLVLCFAGLLLLSLAAGQQPTSAPQQIAPRLRSSVGGD